MPNAGDDTIANPCSKPVDMVAQVRQGMQTGGGLILPNKKLPYLISSMYLCEHAQVGITCISLLPSCRQQPNAT